MGKKVGSFFLYLRRFILFALAIFLAIQLWFFGWVLWYNFFPPQQTSFMSIALDRLEEKNPNAQLRYQWVPYHQISNHLKKAVIAAEDDQFVDHDGVNWEAIEQAWEKNSDKGKIVRGGSTITQQLAKNLFLSGSRSYFRKGEELLISWMLELVMSKQRIYEIYLNVVEWGDGIYGAQEAAKYYFGTNAKNLSADQAARLAVMLPRPRFYQKNPYSAFLNKRTARVLRYIHAAEIP